MTRRPRVLALAAGLLASLCVEALYLFPPTALRHVELRVYDLFLRRLHDPGTSDRVMIVDIDEASLSASGRWPWPRSRLARLLDAIRDQGAAVVAVAMLFPEPDDEASDSALADVLRDPRFVLGYAFTFATGEIDRVPCARRPAPTVAWHTAGSAGAPDGLFRATGVVCSVPAIAGAALGSGFVNAGPDGDGIFRRVPQLMEHDGRVHPSLAVAALAQALGAGHVTVDRASPGVQMLRIADASVPVDAQGTLLLHFRGERKAFPRVSAAELLTGQLPPRSLRDKVVFLDTSAVGIHKVLATPLDPLLPAVEVHATAVDSMLRGDVLVRPGWASAVEMALVLVLGAGVAWPVARMRSGVAALLLVALVGVLAWLALAWMFHGAGIVLSPLFPTMALAASFITVTMLNVTRERQRAAGHLRAAAELAAQVDERRRREEAARDANLAKSEFLSRMSHEFRTPLNAILGFSQLLQMDAVTPEQREGADHIVQAGRHLLFLIDEILDISRIEAGRIRLFPEPVPVAETVDRCLGLIGPLAQARGIELRSAGIDDEWHVHADPKRLDQVLLNVLSNAVKYNREEGTVTVAAHAADAGRLRVSVTDTGPGIPLEKLPLLFTPFERLGAERTGVEGTGLGLALSKQLVEAMGGAMTVASAPGEGTTFTMELGIADRAGSDRGGSPGTAQGAASRQDVPLTIVCIEDDAASLRLVEAIVARRPNTRLIAAAGGRAGLDLAREHQPDLVLLDRHLPDMAGDDVLRHLLEDSRTKHIAVVLMSATASPTDAERLVASGAHAYFTKPLDVTDLASVLDQLAATKP